MGIRVTSVTPKEPQATVSYIDIVADELYYVIASVGGLSYTTPIVSTLYADPDSKNKVLRDITMVVETLMLNTSKGFSDVSAAEDLVAIAISKAAVDVVDIADTYIKGFTKNLAEQLNAFDTFTTVLTKVLFDAAVIADASVLSISKNVSDTIAMADSFTKTTVFNKHFLDNAFVQSALNLSTSKLLHDEYNALDSVGIMPYLSKMDSISTADSSYKVTGKYINDLISNIVESVAFTSFKYITDSVIITDKFHVDPTIYNGDNTLTAFDIHNIDLSKTVSDIGVVSDGFAVGATKNIVDYASAQDIVLVQFSSGASSLFNEFIFNNSTFG